MYTTGTAFLEALQEAGVEYIFANLGSDHPAIVEAIAEAAASNRPIPKVLTCPNEMVALSAAHGYAQTTGRAQAVVVHVECGTQALAGAVHNAAKGRIPVFIFAGASPYTQEGELKGSRNEFIQWIQDVPDQRGLVRGYVKYENEIRTGRNVKQLIHRAMQFAHSEPRGPVYLVGAREAMEETVEPVRIDVDQWQPLAPCALAPDSLQALAADIAKAKRPLIVTSYVGRNTQAVESLIELSERWAIGVLESVPNYMNFPTTNPLYQGNQWNEPGQNDALAEADLVLVIDSDVPWIPLVSKPSESATVYYIDTDPLKQQMPLWYIPAKRAFRADAAVALAQLNDALQAQRWDEAGIDTRRLHYARRHQAWRERLDALESGRPDVITPEYLTARVRAALDDDCIVMSEGISNYQTIVNHLQRQRPGSLFTSGGGSLGWQGGAAIGARLAHPGKTVVTLSGDGSYMFAVPSSVHWMSRRYEAPILQVVYNNRGWKSPKLSALAVHPDGYASRAAADVIGVSFDPPSDYAGIAAAAGGALGLTVKHPRELDAALAAGLRAVRQEGRSAVLDVWLPEL
ncbi:thiamine pyrophosphate-requiring protein [Verticiella sediminum]|uniref:Thiamine pyrophosphate-requiring protein n=1 Tax=Verticiella sediminum TaxID=1247510 RepID=A0A556B032_9BURK|nr:thiamine pyrophosphate-requiring protein [Verticiella sediminum]TSH98542.1 thiamine pyrophosphate-requiring protein [Verticiella sediminum]